MTADLDAVNRANLPNGETLSGASQAEADAACSASGFSPVTSGWVAVSAMAGGLILGVLMAASFGIGSDFRGGDGFLFAEGPLSQQLGSEVSGAGTIGPSFWSKDGVFCRLFSTRTIRAGGLSGIACRENGGWRIRIVTATDAAGELPASVKSLMQNLMVGVPLAPAAEQQARRQGWRSG